MRQSVRVAVALVAVSVAATAASCHAAPRRVLSVHEMISNLDRLNGQKVRVGGYLPSCGGRDCALYADEGEFRRTIAWCGALNRDHKQPSSKPPKLQLGIGSDGDIDRQAAHLVGHYVVI